MKHAKMLVKYQTYLLYDVRVKLKSLEAFEAINYLLNRVKGNISHKFFRKVKASIGQEDVKLYNQFIKLYLEKGFKSNKLSIEEKDNLQNMKI